MHEEAGCVCSVFLEIWMPHPCAVQKGRGHVGILVSKV
jgi:hypothetical protein